MPLHFPFLRACYWEVWTFFNILWSKKIISCEPAVADGYPQTGYNELRCPCVHKLKTVSASVLYLYPTNFTFVNNIPTLENLESYKIAKNQLLKTHIPSLSWTDVSLFLLMLFLFCTFYFVTLVFVTILFVGYVMSRWAINKYWLSYNADFHPRYLSKGTLP